MGTASQASGALPAETSSFVGRRREVAQVRLALSRSRLVTLTGPGGIGKTRLALHTAGQVRRAFPAGVRLAALAPLHTSTSPTPTVVAALGLSGFATCPDDTGALDPDAVAALADKLAGRRMLLVLEAVVFPIVTGAFPLVRRSVGASVAETGCRVVSSVEVPDAVGDGAVGGA
ncbi:AAA family ATPase, partial [Kitasatospora sp. NPDC050543]|uniref:AAA family ATPase n=1 Tax=Kitasatospora sp. NPDC050543 TaxID=3364054 RepID=UPI003788B85D